MLPALPPEWPSGSLRGIETRAGVCVEQLSWDMHEGVAQVVLTSVRERDVILLCRIATERRRPVRLAPRTPVTVTIPLS